MAGNGKKENILTSWKEIAAYLDRDVRTCVRWEQRYGLPIHRLERDSKAKVFAYKDQIDEWLAERSAGGTSRSGGKGLASFLLRPLPILLALAGLAAAAYFLFFRGPSSASPSVPADFHIRGSELVIVDAQDRQLWTIDTKLADLEIEKIYREHSKEKQPGPEYVPVWPHILIRDINGDRQPEVLFSTQTASEDLEGTLFCFDAQGTELWRFEAGRALDFGGRPFRREYRIFGFNPDDYDRDGKLEILVLAHHKPHWPCQAVLLDAAGQLEGEYWNAGYLMDASVGDIDGDGLKELVLSGVNNEYRRGCVAIFAPGELRGSSPQSEASYRSPDLAEGGQIAYILFPKSDVQAAIGRQGDPINRFWIHEGDGLTAMTDQTQIFFDLDGTLAVRNIILSNLFWNLHERFEKEGKVRSIADDQYKQTLADSLLYYRSGNWTGGPSVDSIEIARLNRLFKNKKK